MKKLRTGRLALLLLCTTVLPLALATTAVAGETATSTDDVEKKLTAAKERLNLTPDQEAKMRPLLQEQGERLKAIREKYGDKPEGPAKKARMDELRAAKRDLRDKLGVILSKEQLAEWDTMKDEAVDRIKEKRSGTGR
jgi:hypothetical protein